MDAAATGLDLAALPDDALALLAAAGREDFQFGPGWFRAVAAAALPDGARPLFLLYRESGRAVALLPLQAQGGKLAGLSTPYTSRFRPAVAADADAAALRRAVGPLRLDALEPDWPGLACCSPGFAMPA